MKTLPSLSTVRMGVFERVASLLWAIVIALAIAFCYFASSFCVTLLLATFLSILVDPVVSFFERWRCPRAISSALIIILGMATIGWSAYASYNRLSWFVDRFPAFADRVREIAEPLTHKIAQVEETAGRLNPEPTSKRVTEVKLREPPAWPSYIVRGFGSVSNAVLIIGIVPFLLFFMLVRKEKWYYTLVEVLGPENDPKFFSDQLTRMVRRFAVGNLALGISMAAVTVGVLSLLHIQGSVILGVVSGFLNLIPFLGVVLATAVPVVGGIIQAAPTTSLIIIGALTVFLHIITSSFFAPRLIGSRMNVGPVAATAGLLFWGWLWGIVGVLLAIPLTGTVKLIADCHPSLRHVSNMLGESPNREHSSKQIIQPDELATPETPSPEQET